MTQRVQPGTSPDVRDNGDNEVERINTTPLDIRAARAVRGVFVNPPSLPPRIPRDSGRFGLQVHGGSDGR